MLSCFINTKKASLLEIFTSLKIVLILSFKLILPNREKMGLHPTPNVHWNTKFPQGELGYTFGNLYQVKP